MSLEQQVESIHKKKDLALKESEAKVLEKQKKRNVFLKKIGENVSNVYLQLEFRSTFNRSQMGDKIKKALQDDYGKMGDKQSPIINFRNSGDRFICVDLMNNECLMAEELSQKRLIMFGDKTRFIHVSLLVESTEPKFEEGFELPIDPKKDIKTNVSGEIPMKFSFLWIRRSTTLWEKN